MKLSPLVFSLISTFSLAALLTACAGKVDYTPPSTYKTTNSQTVPMSKDDAWKKLISGLSQEFFVINNMDKESGFINVSYSGDPQLYVDCGMISSYVKNARGERTYTFNGAKAVQDYEIMDMQNGGGLFQIHREMNLEGRINIILQPISDSGVTMTVTTKYVLTRKISSLPYGTNVPYMSSDTANFNSGQSGTLVSPGTGSTTCAANGKLEENILNLLKS